MLKNTKAVGVASAIALLTGVAFAPSATAAVNNYPELSVTSGSPALSNGSYEAVEYYVDYVRTGCKVMTTLGTVTRTEKATTVGSGLTGAVSNKLIPSPQKAGTYTLRSKVANDCKADAGDSNKYNMSQEITIGDEIAAPAATDDWENVGAKAVRITGIASVGFTTPGGVVTGGTPTDLGTVKVIASIRGKMVASTYTDDTTAGLFSIVVDSKYLNKRGNTKVTLSLSSNKFWFMDQDYVVERQLS